MITFTPTLRFAVVLAALTAGCGKSDGRTDRLPFAPSPTTPPIAAPPVATPPVATPPSAPAPPSTAPAATYPVTTVSFTSDPLDRVGQGRSMTFTLENTTFEPIVSRSGSFVQVLFRGKDSILNSWGLFVYAPGGTRVRPGTYETIRTFTDETVWGADFYGQARGCNRATGRITIHAVRFNSDATALEHLRASLETHCEGASPALRAEIAILADPWR
jgi:hypothetical protein